jgi:hypothetical protein
MNTSLFFLFCFLFLVLTFSFPTSGIDPRCLCAQSSLYFYSATHSSPKNRSREPFVPLSFLRNEYLAFVEYSLFFYRVLRNI